MAANAYWKKGGTDWSVAGNWQTNAGAAYGSAPLATDTAIFAEGNDEITGGLALGLDIANINVEKTSQIRLGTTGTSLTSTGAVNATAITYAGSGGYMYWGGNAGTWPTISVDSSGGSFFGTGGTTTTMNISQGKVTNGASHVVTTLRNYGGSTTSLYNATAHTTADVRGGDFTCYRICTTLNISGGRALIQVEQSATAYTTINVNGGYLAINRIPGGITTMNAEGPPGTVVDFSGLTVALTLSTLNIGRWVTFIGSDLLTITTPNLRGNRANAFTP